MLTLAASSLALTALAIATSTLACAAFRAQTAATPGARSIEQWQASLVDYIPAVQIGNTTSFKGGHVPFARYIVSMHNRIHPIFTDGYLSHARDLPSGDIVASIEVVLRNEDGAIDRLGVTRSRGVTAFDVAAFEAIMQASPFGKAPDTIVSPGGRVYMHWDFHRSPQEACSPRNARPFMLAHPP